MAISNAVNAFGTLLQRGNGAGSEVFTTVAEVTNITGPALSLEMIEVTNHTSTSGWKERIGGLLDAGEVGFEINFLPASGTGHGYNQGLITDIANRTKRNFKIVFPDTNSTTWQFAGFVTKFSPKAPVNAQLSATVSIQITGVPSLT